MRIAVVLPVLNEAARLEDTLRPVLQSGCDCIMVDGGSTDSSVELARSLGVRVLSAPKGRATQMNAGAAICDEADAILFLHADVGLPAGWDLAVRRVLEQGCQWGRFDVALDSRKPLLRMVAALMNLRSRWSGIATGDQAIFVSRRAWLAVGGFPAIALMEDIELSAALRRKAGKPACLAERVMVSARRWETHGIVRTILVMWGLRALHALGMSPRLLHRLYYGRDHERTRG